MHLAFLPSVTAALFLMLSHVQVGTSSPTLSHRDLKLEPTFPFDFTYLFTAHLALGKSFSSPIAIPGGVLVAEPIANGTVTGPAINATIIGGIATPAIYNNGTIQAPVIQAWGVTSDGFGFVINEIGIGSPKGQVTRIQLTVGGGALYETLRNGYVLASVNPNLNQTEVAVHGYLVSNIATFE